MKILTIMGTHHKGNTRAIVDLFLKEFKKSLKQKVYGSICMI